MICASGIGFPEGNGVIFDRIAQTGRKGNHAGTAAMGRKGAGNCLAIDKEYGTGCAAGPVFLSCDLFFSRA